MNSIQMVLQIWWVTRLRIKYSVALLSSIVLRCGLGITSLTFISSPAINGPLGVYGSCYLNNRIVSWSFSSENRGLLLI